MTKFRGQYTTERNENETKERKKGSILSIFNKIKNLRKVRDGEKKKSIDLLFESVSEKKRR